MRRYTPRVFQIASRFFRQRSQVEDVSQEVFLKAYTQLASFQGRGSLEGWISKITTNTCLNILRSAKRHPESTLADLTAEEARWLENKVSAFESGTKASAERSLIAADLAERVLKGLAAEDRLVLLLLDGDETPVKDVSEMMGWSVSKVKIRAMRARRKMRKAVEMLLGSKKLAPIAKTVKGR